MRLKTTKLIGTFYHGTLIKQGENQIENFEHGWSDWGAVWFTDDEAIAQRFSDWGGIEEGDKKCIYQVQIKAAKIAKIPYETAEELKGLYYIHDLRETIPFLKKKGYNGWVTSGAIDGYEYEDYALFNLSNVKITGISFEEDGEWSEFKPINNLMEKKKLNKIKRILEALENQVIKEDNYDSPDMKYASENMPKDDLYSHFDESLKNLCIKYARMGLSPDAIEHILFSIAENGHWIAQGANN